MTCECTIKCGQPLRNCSNYNSCCAAALRPVRTPPPIQQIDEQRTPDLINHPPHYMGHPSGVECITITEHMNFNLGNAMKYIWRSSAKGATLDDLKKARWYVDREISRLERNAK